MQVNYSPDDVYEGLPELRGVQRFLMSTNEWFVICCLLGNYKFLERSQRKPQLNRNELNNLIYI